MPRLGAFLSIAQGSLLPWETISKKSATVVALQMYTIKKWFFDVPVRGTHHLLITPRQVNCPGLLRNWNFYYFGLTANVRSGRGNRCVHFQELYFCQPA
jgi:hypothetical protein